MSWFADITQVIEMARKTAVDAEVTRQKLLGAGLEVFALDGYSAATLERVAQQAGVSRGAVYWHFKGKDALLQELLDSSVLPLETFWVADANLQAGLWHLQVAMQATFYQDAARQLCEILLHRSERLAAGCAIGQRLQQAQWRFHGQIKGMLMQGVLQGELAAELDVEATCEWLRVCCTGLIFECLRQPGEIDRHVASTLTMLCRMLAHQPGLSVL